MSCFFQHGCSPYENSRRCESRCSDLSDLLANCPCGKPLRALVTISRATLREARNLDPVSLFGPLHQDFPDLGFSWLFKAA